MHLAGVHGTDMGLHDLAPLRNCIVLEKNALSKSLSHVKRKARALASFEGPVAERAL